MIKNNFIIGLGTVAVDTISKVDKLPKKDESCIIETQQEYDGGGCANVITQVEKLGIPTAMISQIGDDDIGKKIIKGLKAYNIDTSWMQIKKGGISFKTQIYVDQNGGRMIIGYKGDSLLTLKSDQIDYSFVTRCKVFYTDLLPPSPAIEIAKRVKSLGKFVVFNMEMNFSSMKILGLNYGQIVEMLKITDVFAPCRTAAYKLTNVDDPLTCIKKLRLVFSYKGLIILTLGADGALINDGKETIDIPSFKVNTIDTTGAGDSFIGAFMVARYFLNKDLRQSGRFASAAAAFTCTHIGARNSPTLNEVNIFLEGR